MEQERIHYKEVMDLGFDEETDDDQVYENEYGYPYKIITKKLTKRISIDWDQVTGFCEVIRCNKEEEIIARERIIDIVMLKRIVSFFCVKDVFVNSSITYAA